MMLTRDAILAAFKEQFLEIPLSKITVASICNAAHISRKTFYSHFVDKNDLIKYIILTDLIYPMFELRRLLPTNDIKSAPKILIEHIHTAIYENRDFYSQLMRQMGKYEFMEVLIEELANYNRQVLAGSNLPERELEYKAYFFASSHSILMIKWIQDEFLVSESDLAAYFYNWALCNWPGDDSFKKRWSQGNCSTD